MEESAFLGEYHTVDKTGQSGRYTGQRVYGDRLRTVLCSTGSNFLYRERRYTLEYVNDINYSASVSSDSIGAIEMLYYYYYY